MNPLLSLLCVLVGWRTFLGRCHSFLASLMATTPLLFSTCTLHDRSRPSNSGVQTVKALHHAGAAMFMRSTTGCGTLAGSSLALEGFRSQNQEGSADSPGLKHPCALGRLARPAVFKLLLTRKRYDKYIPELYLAYITSE